MSVSHATPPFLHSHRRTHHGAKSRDEAKTDPRHRTKVILAGVGLVLFGILVTGIVGIALTVAPAASASGGYRADGSLYVIPPGWATVWLGVTLMDVVAIIAYGIATAAHFQQ